MVLFVVFGVLAVFASTGVDCRYWSQQSYSTSSDDGKMHTITQIDDNGNKELISSQTGSDGHEKILSRISDHDGGNNGFQNAALTEGADPFQQISQGFEQMQHQLDSVFRNPFATDDFDRRNDDEYSDN